MIVIIAFYSSLLWEGGATVPKTEMFAANEPDIEMLKYSSEYLHVHNSGMYTSSYDILDRPEGTQGYLIIYLSSGKGYLKSSGNENAHRIPVMPGTAMLFLPGEAQYFESMEEHCCYWVHFFGYGVEQILNNCGLSRSRLFRLDKDSFIEHIIIRIYHELDTTPPFHNDVCNGLVIDLLTSIARKKNAPSSILNEVNRLNPAIEHMYTHYFDNISMEEYAARCNMSQSHFCREFKDYTGYSPINFLKKIRLCKAMDLLIATKRSISSIAETVGYSDALYFSRIFKKFTGKSPTDYRQSSDHKLS